MPLLLKHSTNLKNSNLILNSARFPTELSLSELLNGVVNKEVLKKRPNVLKNKYYGLRRE